MEKVPSVLIATLNDEFWDEGGERVGGWQELLSEGKGGGSRDCDEVWENAIELGKEAQWGTWVKVLLI